MMLVLLLMKIFEDHSYFHAKNRAFSGPHIPIQLTKGSAPSKRFNSEKNCFTESRKPRITCFMGEIY